MPNMNELSVLELRTRLVTIAKIVGLEYQEAWIRSLSKKEILTKIERIRNGFRK